MLATIGILQVAGGSDLLRIKEYLQKIKEDGVTQNDVYQYLEHWRMDIKATNEALDDRILDVMDIVSGYCSSILKVC